MPSYNYQARDKDGKHFAATIEARDELSAALLLRSFGYSVISIQEQVLSTNVFVRWVQRFRKIGQYELVFFNRQLASLLKAGISLTAALSSISEQIKNQKLKERLDAILADIQAGRSFSQALSKHTDVFSDLFINMVRVGEVTGMLDQVLERLAQLYTQELEVRTRIRSAMTYPIILVCVAMLVVSFLLVNIIPKFVVIFETYGAQLPLPTQILLGVSLLFRKFWIWILAACGGCWFAGKRYIGSSQGRYRFDVLLLHVPLFGELYVKAILSRFSRTLGVMVKSGVPILQALSVTEKTVRNTALLRAIENIRYAIVEGKSIVEPFKASGVFPATIIQMVSLGEKSGRLDDMLIEVADFYDRDADYAIKNLTTILEPLLLLVMGGIVAFIALSVLLPIFNLIKVFR